MKLLTGGRGIAVGRKPNYVPNDREEIIRIIEKEKKMSYGHKGVGGKTTAPDIWLGGSPTGETQEERDMWEPIGERPWPLRLALPAALKFIGKIYMWGCTVGVSAFIVYAYVIWIIGE